jgi:hypothetical protein
MKTVLILALTACQSDTLHSRDFRPRLAYVAMRLFGEREAFVDIVRQGLLNQSTRYESLTYLYEFPGDRELTVKRLDAIVTKCRQSEKWQIAAIVGARCSKCKSSPEILANLIGREGDDLNSLALRAFAANCMLDIGVDSQTHVDKLLNTNDSVSIQLSCQVLGKLGVAARPCLARLRELSRHGDEAIASDAKKAIALIDAK